MRGIRTVQTCVTCSASFMRVGRPSKLPRCDGCRKPGCAICGEPVHSRNARRCLAHAGMGVARVSLVDQTARYADDVGAQLFVEAFPSGAPSWVVAEAMGVSAGLVELIERQARESMRRRLRLVGIDGIADAVFARPEHPLAGTWCEEVA